MPYHLAHSGWMVLGYMVDHRPHNPLCSLSLATAAYQIQSMLFFTAFDHLLNSMQGNFNPIRAVVQLVAQLVNSFF